MFNNKIINSYTYKYFKYKIKIIQLHLKNLNV